MIRLKIPPITPLCVLLFKNLQEKSFTGGNGGASRIPILSASSLPFKNQKSTIKNQKSSFS
jgi:hypothetical protein